MSASPRTEVQPPNPLSQYRSAMRTPRWARSVVALAASAILLVGCTGGPEETSTDPGTSAPATSQSSGPATPSGSESSAAPGSSGEVELIDYTVDSPDGIQIRTDADLDKLVGAPDAFKTMLQQTLAEALKECDSATVYVDQLRTDGFAKGGVTACGGHAVFWAVIDDRWQEAWAGQDAPDCASLKAVSFPSSIAGDQCLGEDGKVQPYRQD